MAKALIRSDLLARRRRLPAADCLEWSRRIQQSFMDLPELQGAKRIGLYSSIHNEVSTTEIFRLAREVGIEVAYPRMRGQQFEFALVFDLRELKLGAFGILEPTREVSVPIGSLDVVGIPGVAFDLAGHRLGYGKGFFDRVFTGPRNHGILVGLCYELQMIESLPAASHDVRMDLLVTENRVLRFDGEPAGSRYTLGGGLS